MDAGRIRAATLQCAALAGALAMAATAASAAATDAPGELAGPVAAGSLSSQQGEARDPASGRLLYREQHWLRRDAGGQLRERLVLYLCPDGGAFARKRMDYRAAPLAPAFDLEDARSGYREGLRRTPSPRLYVRSGRGAAERSAALPGGNIVADAGFDEFVRLHWDSLAGGHAAAIEFALPARLRSYRFSLAPAGRSRIAGEEALLLRLRLDGWLAWLAPHMDIAYGVHSRRLLRFEGMSNLADPAGGRNWLTRIDFPTPARAADPGGWALASAAALAKCPVTRAADTGSGRADTQAGAAGN